MPGGQFGEFRRLYLAAVDDVGAAGVKGAAWGRVDWAGDVALEQALFALQFGVRHRHG